MSLSISTIKMYESHLKNYKFDYCDTPNILKHLYLINSKLSNSAIKNILCAIIWCLREKETPIDIINQYTVLIKNLSIKTNKEEIDPNKHKFIPLWDDIIKKYNSIDDIEKKLIVSFYILIPPRRLKDYEYLYYNALENKINNYYDSNTKELIFNNYKTSKKYGPQHIKVPETLHVIIEKYVSEKNIKNNEMIIKYSSSSLYHKLFGLLSCSVDGLRHSYVNNFYNKKFPMSNEIEELAYLMGHDVKTNLRYRKNM